MKFLLSGEFTAALKTQSRRPDSKDFYVRYRAIRDIQRDAFGVTWIPWLRHTMKRAPEAEDLAIMADPATYYRREGANAFRANLNNQVFGAVAVKKLGAAGFEFCKLVVSDDARVLEELTADMALKLQEQPAADAAQHPPVERPVVADRATPLAFTSVALNMFSEIYVPLAVTLNHTEPSIFDRPAPIPRAGDGRIGFARMVAMRA